MHVLIAADGRLSLEDVENLKAFSIVEIQVGSAATALSEIGEAVQDNHYWLDAEAVVALSSRKDDPDWVASFWTMLEKVEKYGFSDLTNKRGKAHVE